MNNLNTIAGDIFSLELFFEVSPDLMCIAGYDGYFKRINPAFSKVLEYTEEELLSRPINEFIYKMDQDITEKYRDNLRNSIPLLNFENRYLTKGGEIVWLSWTSIPVPEKKQVYAIAKNITHQKKVEEERNILLSNLTKINNELKHLTFTTSHDLRSPVNNLLCVFNMIDVSKIEDDETRGFIEILKSTTSGLKETLNNYIETVTEKNKSSAYIEELNLNSSLQEVLHSIHSLVEDSKAIIEVDFSEFEMIKFNRSYLNSIFLNLITNSIKYTRPEYPPAISISSRMEMGIKQLVFSDKGMGFDMEKVKYKIFGLHQKFHDHTDSKGIGLYLIYNHITNLGGHIRIESKVNEGAKFVISFKD